MFKFFKEKIEQRQEEKEEKEEVELSPEDKERLAKLKKEFRKKENLAEYGAKFIQKDPYFAGVCFKEAGYDKEAEILFGLARYLKENEKQRAQEPVKETELPPDDKLRVKGMGLRLLAQNQNDTARTLFKGIGLPDEEIESLLELNFFGIEEEEKKIKKELEKMRQEKEED